MRDKLNYQKFYRDEVVRLIRDLTTVHYYPNSDNRTFSVLDPLSQCEIAHRLGVTNSTISRAANGVVSLSGELFFVLATIHAQRLSSVLGYRPAISDLPF